MVVGNIPEAVDLAVIGAGPGGYAAALRGARRGRRVMLVDRDGTAGVGGVCLRIGCIPSKALIETAELRHRAAAAAERGIDLQPGAVDLARFQQWKEGIVGGLTGGVLSLLAAAEVEIVGGRFTFTAPDGGVIETLEGQARHIQFRDLVLATGSRPRALPDFPFDGERVSDSTGALALTAVPESLAVIGGGYVGLEIGTALAKLGCRVSVVEAQARILPTMDGHLTAPITRRLRELGVEVLASARVIDLEENGLLVEHDGAVRSVPAEKVLVAIGRDPNSDGLELAVAGIEAREDGLLEVAPDRRITAHVAAIGDLTPGPALAHKAMAEAEVAVAALCGETTAFEPAAIPAVVFSDPELATAGLTAEQARAQGAEPTVATVPMTASGRAATLGERAGFAQIVADAGDGTVLGVHIVGPHASELIAEGVLAIEMGATLEDLALTIHAHPTLGEQLAEAAHLGLGSPLHVALRR
jgi:dihydrolipoamide dehydrogenase